MAPSDKPRRRGRCVHEVRAGARPAVEAPHRAAVGWACIDTVACRHMAWRSAPQTEGGRATPWPPRTSMSRLTHGSRSRILWYVLMGRCECSAPGRAGRSVFLPGRRMWSRRVDGSWRGGRRCGRPCGMRVSPFASRTARRPDAACGSPSAPGTPTPGHATQGEEMSSRTE
jgi:hypothetical protein